MTSLRQRLGNAAYGLVVLALLIVVGIASSGNINPFRMSINSMIAKFRDPKPSAAMSEWWEPKQISGVICISEADMRLPNIGIANRFLLAHPPVDRATLNELIPQIQLWQKGMAVTPEMMTRLRITSTECLEDWPTAYNAIDNVGLLLLLRSRMENPDNPTNADLHQAYLTHRYTQTGPPGAVEIALEYYPVEPIHHDK